MSTSKLDRSGVFQALHVHGAQTRLTLSPESVKIRPNGVEFRADKAIAQWTEMTIDLLSAEGEKVHCNGVVVECNGNRHTGYHVSILFMNLTKKAQDRLDWWALSNVARP
jgi:hypothetical protein